MSTKKTIQINPELFKLPSNKTRKAREKKEMPLVPIVSPNTLKNKLLKRIKEHKTKEINSKINNKLLQEPNQTFDENYNDEFYGAINYLSDLAKKNKNDIEKERYQRTLHNKTLKQFSSENNSLYVASNLPPELEPLNTHTDYFIPEKTSNAINLKYKPDEDIPYGCLKGGVKPSYKSWVQTRKNYEHPELENIAAVRPPTPPKRNTYIDEPASIISTPIITNSVTNSNQLTREQRLKLISNKLKLLQEQENMFKPEFKTLKKELNMLEPLINNTKTELDVLPDVDGNTRKSFVVPEILQTDKKNETPKKYIKKTIRRKFTLGKSNKMRKVSVLIKDNKTRKNIVNAQKELKKIDLTDVKKHLRKHGMNKTGSVAPQGLLRTTFEYAMMAGDVTNTNKDTLLHNFIHDQ
jgi:hypothetical protein